MTQGANQELTTEPVMHSERGLTSLLPNQSTVFLTRGGCEKHETDTRYFKIRLDYSSFLMADVLFACEFPSGRQVKLKTILDCFRAG